jgi:large subunit ribosomal protein L17
MRKKVFGKQLKRDKNERAALFRGLMTSLVLNESIQTTETKARAIKGEIEKLVTRARKEKELAKRLLGKRLNTLAIEKMINTIAPRFEKRNGGYTRMIKLGKRFGDDAEMVILEFVEKSVKVVAPLEKTAKASSPKDMKKTVKSEKVEKKVSEKVKKEPAKKVTGRKK